MGVWASREMETIRVVRRGGEETVYVTWVSWALAHTLQNVLEIVCDREKERGVTYYSAGETLESTRIEKGVGDTGRIIRRDCPVSLLHQQRPSCTRSSKKLIRAQTYPVVAYISTVQCIQPPMFILHHMKLFTTNIKRPILNSIRIPSTPKSAFTFSL